MDKTLLVRYLWILPYFGGVLILISILTPAASSLIIRNPSDSYTIWLWGLITIHEFIPTWYNIMNSTTFAFVSNPLIMIIGLLITFLIGGMAIKIIITARKFANDEKDLDIRFMKYGGFVLIGIITWIIIMEILFSIFGFMEWGSNFSFWNYFNVNFGTIGIFLGSFFSIGGYLMDKIIHKRYDYLFYED
ncbi:MAG: hypothetical protein HWN81_18225 [Candidatus Lokiarchaeota archaeon]|nr:hypothetical protein [Candidatus Lokiarchaeota archaeon]